MEKKSAIKITGLGMVVLLAFSLSAFSACKKGKGSGKANMACDTTGGWNKLTSAEGKFTAFTPGATKKQTKMVPTAIGPIKITMYVKGTSNSAYFVAFSDYPAKLVSKVSADKLLERGSKEGLKRIPGAKILANKSYKYKGYAARDIRAGGKVQGTSMELRAKYIMAANRLYQVMAIYAAGKSDSDAKRFIKCFDLKK